MADERNAAALEQLVNGFGTRQVMDDKNGRPLPWTEFEKLYNDVTFKPDNYFLDDPNSVARLREIDPGAIDREVSDKQLKGKVTYLTRCADDLMYRCADLT